jgi:hypothetical protein
MPPAAKPGDDESPDERREHASPTDSAAGAARERAAVDVSGTFNSAPRQPVDAFQQRLDAQHVEVRRKQLESDHFARDMYALDTKLMDALRFAIGPKRDDVKFAERAAEFREDVLRFAEREKLQLPFVSPLEAKALDPSALFNVLKMARDAELYRIQKDPSHARRPRHW